MPAPFGPITATSSPGGGLEAHPPQRFALPEPLDQPPCLQAAAVGLSALESAGGTLDLSLDIEAMPFPATRMRRLRSTDTFRSLVRETELSPPT